MVNAGLIASISQEKQINFASNPEIVQTAYATDQYEQQNESKALWRQKNEVIL